VSARTLVILGRVTSHNPKSPHRILRRRSYWVTSRTVAKGETALSVSWSDEKGFKMREQGRMLSTGARRVIGDRPHRTSRPSVGDVPGVFHNPDCKKDGVRERKISL